jgi:sodium/potassium-transporting ATPase subunit alpha
LKKACAHIAGGFSLLLWAGGFLCFIVYGIDGSIPDLTLGIVLCVVVMATGIFSYLQELKSEAVLDAFMKLTPESCFVKRDGTEINMEARNLTLGDVVRLTAGQKVPADVIMIESNGIKVDNSSLTGEAEPLKRTIECTDPMPTRTKNVAFFGTAVHEGEGYGVVVRIGDNTTMGDIARSVLETEKPKALMELEIERFVHIISGIALSIGIIFFAVGMGMGYEVKRALIFTIGIIVANVPEGLLATVTVALTITAQRMAGKEVHVKSTLIVETLGSITCIASDKTGTLTQNRMSVVSAIYPDGTIEVDQKHPKRRSLKEREEETPTIQLISNPKYVDCQKHLIEVAGLCNHAKFQDGMKDTDILHRRTKGDASEAALLKFSHSNGHVDTLRDDYKEVACVAFNSTNKFMITIHTVPDSTDYRLCIKGAPERVMDRCSTATDPNTNGPTPFTAELKAAVTKSNFSLAGNGERVLAFGEQIVKGLPKDFKFDTDDIKNTNFPMDGFRFVGMLALEDPHRPEVPGAVDSCHEASIRVIMVTGDHPLTARSIASKIRILPQAEDLDTIAPIFDVTAAPEARRSTDFDNIVVTGDVLDKLTDDDWEYILTRNGIVFARTLPTQKQDIVEKLQRAKDEGGLDEVVAVTGDGVNDSPALKSARVGIAMGTGAQVAHDAADLILMDDNFASIVAGIEEGRLIFANLKKSISYTLTSNIPEIIPFLAQICFRFPLGLTTIMILCIDLGTDILPAISFAYETAESDIMKIPPRDRHTDVLVTGSLISWSYLQIGIIQAMASFTTFFQSLKIDGFTNKMVLQDGLGFEWDKEDSEIGDACFSSTTTSSSDGCATYEERTTALMRAQTAFLACIVICQIGCGLSAKTRLSSVFTHGMHNMVFNYGLLQESILIVLLVYVPGLNFAFSTEPIHGISWSTGIPFAVTLLAYDETRKLIMRMYPDSTFKKWLYY